MSAWAFGQAQHAAGSLRTSELQSLHTLGYSIPRAMMISSSVAVTTTMTPGMAHLQGGLEDTSSVTEATTLSGLKASRPTCLARHYHSGSSRTCFALGRQRVAVHQPHEGARRSPRSRCVRDCKCILTQRRRSMSSPCGCARGHFAWSARRASLRRSGLLLTAGVFSFQPTRTTDRRAGGTLRTYVWARKVHPRVADSTARSSSPMRIGDALHPPRLAWKLEGKKMKGDLEGCGADTGHGELLGSHARCESTCHKFVHSVGKA